ncbi:hypothetical protein LTR95_006250 [Oleoguttula sp. CCFEE 5521]
METSDGIPLSDDNKCHPCRKAGVECRVRADKKSSKCGKCYISCRPCDAGPDAPGPKRGAPRKVTGARPRVFRESLRRHHLKGRGSATRKYRDRSGETAQSVEGTPVTEAGSQAGQTLSADTTPSIELQDRVPVISVDQSATGCTHDPMDASPATSVTHTRASSIDTQATLDRSVSVKTENSSIASPFTTDSRFHSPDPPLSSNARTHIMQRHSDGIADGEIEVLRAEATGARVEALAVRSEAALMRAVFERSKRKMAMKQAIDLTED